MGKIIDFIFPRIDKPSTDEMEEEQNRRHSTEKEIMAHQFCNDEVELMLKISDEYEKRENDRLHEVESKATVFIGTLSVAVTILMTLLKEFMLGSSLVFLPASSICFRIVMSILLVAAIFYLCFAILNSVKTLQRQKFSVLGVKELLNAGEYASVIIESNQVSKGNGLAGHFTHKMANIARKKLFYTYRNENVINRKVEYMTLAQEFFKNAVGVLIIMILLLVGYMIWYVVGDCIMDFWSMISAAQNN